LGTLATQRLGAFRVIPDLGYFEFAIDFRQAFAALIVVKDTPSRHRGGLACL